MRYSGPCFVSSLPCYTPFTALYSLTTPLALTVLPPLTATHPLTSPLPHTPLPPSHLPFPPSLTSPPPSPRFVLYQQRVVSWSYGPVTSAWYPLAEVDTSSNGHGVPPQRAGARGGSGGAASQLYVRPRSSHANLAAPALRIIVEQKHLDLLSLPVMRMLVDDKWFSFVRCRTQRAATPCDGGLAPYVMEATTSYDRAYSPVHRLQPHALEDTAPCTP